MPPSLLIPRHPGLSPESFRQEFLQKHLPVVIPGGIAHWPAVSKWTPDYLRSHAGSAQVEVLSKSDYSDGGSLREAQSPEALSFSRLIDMMEMEEAPEMSYARQTPVLEELPALSADVGTLPFFPQKSPKVGPLMWVGPKGTVAQLHWDPGHNLYTQVRGSKKAILLSPDDSHLTYPNVFPLEMVLNEPDLFDVQGFIPRIKKAATEAQYKAGSTDSPVLMNAFQRNLNDEDIGLLIELLAGVNNCHVNAEHPNLDQHPSFSGVTCHETTLEPGDVLFIPDLWRHYFRSTLPSININWFFAPMNQEKDSRQTRLKTIIEHIE